MKHIFSSESVTEGHPDKLCDQISDAILDACLEQDPDSRVAVETLAKTGMILVAGELTTKATVDIPSVVRSTIREIGYTDSSLGIDADTCAVLVHLDKQSPDIALGLDEGSGREQGAGDQGLMFGFACNETEEKMPLPISLAHKLSSRLAFVRKKGIVPYLGPDGKSQVSVLYEHGSPVHLDTVLVSTQHSADVSVEKSKDDIVKNVIEPACAGWFDGNTKVLVNPTGKFVLGGPHADAGLTGRKIIVDTYGGVGRHGGGAFSGKDPSKVDRSAAYMARYIAKNIVAAKLADKCEVQLAYAIGVAEPVSVFVDTFQTGHVPDDRITEAVIKVFPLKPKDLIAHLGLKTPGFRRTAAYGHFGREEFSWEKTDKADALRKACD